MAEEEPRYSLPALRKKLAMCGVGAVVLCEGISDRTVLNYVVSKNKERLKGKLGVKTGGDFSAKRVSGKSFLLTFWQFLKDNGGSSVTLDGETGSAMFILDDDYDRFLKLQIVSDDIVYTNGICIENDVMQAADLHAAIAWIAGLDRDDIPKAAFGDSWFEKTARQFEHLCYISCGLKIVNYPPLQECRSVNRVREHVGKKRTQAEDAADWKKLREAADKLGKDGAKLDAAVAAIAAGFGGRQFHQCISGKWLIELLSAEMLDELSSMDIGGMNRLRERALEGFCQSVDFKAKWCDRYVTAIVGVLSK
jgi:hypothetical protein